MLDLRRVGAHRGKPVAGVHFDRDVLRQQSVQELHQALKQIDKLLTEAGTERKAAPSKADVSSGPTEVPAQATPASDEPPAARKSASRSRRPRKPAAKKAEA